jgi:hypothetical protein
MICHNYYYVFMTEWVARLFNALQARASIWLNQVAPREAPG